MTKIFIATPAFDGKTHVPYAIALAETVLHLSKFGIQCQFAINCSGSLLVAERNRLMKQFISSDCTHILCVDSDLGWSPLAVKALLDHGKDFVAGVYPSRRDNIFTFRPVYREDQSLIKEVSNNAPLFQMNFIPAGFMLIRRNVIEKLIADNPKLYFEPKHPDLKHESGHYLFSTELRDGEFWGEDYVFCQHVRDSGFEIWVDPLIEFDHAGVRGCLTSVLTDQPPDKQEAN